MTHRGEEGCPGGRHGCGDKWIDSKPGVGSGRGVLCKATRRKVTGFGDPSTQVRRRNAISFAILLARTYLLRAPVRTNCTAPLMVFGLTLSMNCHGGLVGESRSLCMRI